MKKKVVITGFLLAFAAFSLMVKTDLRKEKSPLAALQIGAAMEDFTLYRTDGEEVTFRQLASGKKMVVINFWASWCGPCRVEMPGFSNLYTAREKDGLLILGVNEDEKRADMDQYLVERPVSFPVLVDRDSAAMKRFGVRALPTTILVNSDGQIIHVQEGIVEYLEFLVDSHLKLAQSMQQLR